VSAAWALALAAALAYLPSLAGTFQFDDYNVIVNETAVHSWSAFLERATGVRPLLKASYTLSWTVGGFHVFNVAVHAVNTLLVYQLGRYLSAAWSADPLTRGSRADFASGGFLAALLFALHPAQVEAVTYISGRSTSLMAAFYLGAVLVYLRRGHWALSGLLFVLAAATKETALTLPAALLLCDLATQGRPEWKRQLPHWGIFALCAAFVLANSRYLELVGFGFTRRDIGDNLLAQAGGVSYLVARLLGFLGPNIDPALPALYTWTPALLFQVLLFFLLLVIGMLQLRRRPWLGFGLLWFFLHLAPTNSVIPRLDVANDRQLYLAGWGLFLAAAACVPRRLVLPAAALVALLAVGSIARQLDYRSEIALWEADTRRAPWNARAWNNLGYAYQQAGRPADARRAYERALVFDPSHVKARFNLQTLN
jgi:tetratricopeptide (TPR) repeat protein